MQLTEIIDKLPSGLRIRRLLETIWAELTFPQSCPPGHFYSPIPSRKDLTEDKSLGSRSAERNLPEIDLYESLQLDLMEKLADRARNMALAPAPSPPVRYFTNNDYFFYADAIVLATLLLELRPKHYVEVGSGFSSALVLDTRERIPELELKCTFIEPAPKRLFELMREGDRLDSSIVESKVQDVPDALFRNLQRNDILFVDGSHVAKIHSDLNDLLFRICPLLRPGVVIHFHDIFWPFEYRAEDVLRGRSWNEAYFLRAFLANNQMYRILFFGSYLEHCHKESWFGSFPRAMPGEASSLWLVKTGK